MADYMNVIRYTPPQKTYQSSFRWMGMDSDEAYAKKVINSHKEFWDKRTEYLGQMDQMYSNAPSAIDTSSTLFNNLKQYNSWNRNAVLAGSNLLQTKDQWGILKNITTHRAGKDSFGTGYIYSYDTETMGAFSPRGKDLDYTTITELGITRQTYENAIRKDTGVESLSLAYGVTEKQYDNYQGVIEKVRNGTSLDKEESVIADRLSLYSGDYNKRFRRTTSDEQTFLRSLGFENTDLPVAIKLAEHVNKQDPLVLESGLKNLKQLGLESSLDNELGQTSFRQAVSAITRAAKDDHSAVAVYNGRFDVNAINYVSDLFNINAPMLNNNQNVDIMNALRASSASHGLSIMEYVQQIAGASNKQSNINELVSGGTLEDLAFVLGIPGEFHNAGSDAFNTATIAGIVNFFRQEVPKKDGTTRINHNTIADEALNAINDYSSNGKQYEVGDTLLFKRDIRLDNNVGDFAKIGDSVVPFTNTTNRFWKLHDLKSMEYKGTDGETNTRLMADFKNAAYENMQMPESHVYKSFESEEAFNSFVLEQTSIANEVSQKEINKQQKLMDIDLGRRQWDKLWDSKDIAINSGQEVMGGFEDLKKFSEFHDTFLDKVAKIKEGDSSFIEPNNNSIIYSKYDDILNEVGKELNVNSYDVKNYKYMFSKFTNENKLIHGIIDKVDNMQGLNAMQKTRIASGIYNNFQDAISPGTKIGSHIKVLSNISDEAKGVQALNDIVYMDIKDVNGDIRKINVADVTQGASDLKRAYTRPGITDENIIKDMISGISESSERLMGSARRDLKQVIRTVEDYTNGNADAKSYNVASIFASALNRNFDVTNMTGMSIEKYKNLTDFNKAIGEQDSLDDVYNKPFHEKLMEYKTLSDSEKMSFLESNGLDMFPKDIDTSAAYMVHQKNFHDNYTVGEKAEAYRNGLIRYEDSRHREHELSINDAMDKTWFSNIQSGMDETASHLETIERGILFSNTGTFQNDKQIIEVAKEVASGLNYDKLNTADYDEAVSSISKILTHYDKNNPDKSYGLLHMKGYQTTIFRPNSINGETFFVTTPENNFAKIYNIMNEITESNVPLSGPEIEERLLKNNAAVIPFKKLHVREFLDGSYATSVPVGVKGQERFLTDAINTYTGKDGKNAGYLYANIESGPIQMLNTYRKIGARDYIPRIKEGRYDEATRIMKRQINAIIVPNPGVVGQQTVVQDGIVSKMVVPNLADMNTANTISLDGFIQAIPDMVDMDPNNQELNTLLRPFVPEDRYGNNTVLNRDTSEAIINNPEFKEFFFKHLTVPVKDDYVFTAAGISQGHIEKIFNDKTILEIFRDYQPKDHGALFRHEGGSIPSVLDGIIKNPMLFGALKEHQVDNWMVNTSNPLRYNPYSIWDAYSRPTNMQQLTLRYFNPFAEGNSDLLNARSIARVGDVAMSKQDFTASQLRMNHENGDLNSAYAKRRITGYIKQADDLDIAAAYSDFESSGRTLKERIAARLEDKIPSHERKSAQATLNRLDNDKLTALYDIMKNEMDANYEGSLLIRPSVWNTDFFRTPDLRNVAMPDITSNEDIKRQALEVLRKNPKVERDQVLATYKAGSNVIKVKWNDNAGVITNPDEFIETGDAIVMPLNRAIGNAKVMAYNEKFMGHSISYDLTDKNSQIGKIFPNLRDKVLTGAMSEQEAKHTIDTYTDFLMSGIFGTKTSAVANMGLKKHMTGSNVYGSKMNIILNEVSKSGNEEDMQHFINELNRNGFKDWNFEINYDDNPNYSKPKPIFTYDYDDMLQRGNTKGHVIELMQLEAGIRSGEIGSDKNGLRQSIIKALDEANDENLILTGMGRGLNQEKMGTDFKLNSRVNNVLDLQETDNIVVPGYNADKNGKLYTTVIREKMEESLYGKKDASYLTREQKINQSDRVRSVSVLQSMESALDNMSHAQDLAQAQNVLSVHFDELNVLKSGSSRRELELSIFGINGAPSEFIQRLARLNNKDVKKVNMLRMQLPNGLSVNMPNQGIDEKTGRAISNTLSEVLIPLQNVRVSERFDSGFYAYSQKEVVRFLNTIKEYQSGLSENKDITTLKSNVQKSFENMYGAIQYDLGTNSDSMYSRLMERVSTPNSAQFSAQKIEAPILKEWIVPQERWGGRTFKQEYERIKNDGITPEMSYDQKQIKRMQNSEKAEQFKTSVTKEYADRIRGGEYLELATDRDYKGKSLKLFNGELKEVDTYANNVYTSRAGMAAMGLDKADIGIDVYKHLGRRGNLKRGLVDEGWTESLSRREALNKFIGFYNDQNPQAELSKQNAHKHILDNTNYVLEYETELDDEIITNKIRLSFEDALKESSKEDGTSFGGISIRDLNKSTKEIYRDVVSQRKNKSEEIERIENAFSFLRDKYLKEVGIAGIDGRNPMFHQGAILPVLLRLDDKLANDTTVLISSPFASAAQNLDLDGDSKFDKAHLNDFKRLLKSDDELSVAAWGEYKRINLTNNKLLADLIEDTSFADNPNDVIDYSLNAMKIINPDLYDEVEKTGFDRKKVIESLVSYSDKNANMLTNQEVLITALKAKTNKSGIGSYSTPNFRVRTVMQDLRNTEYIDGDNWSTIMKDLSTLDPEKGLFGLLISTEQKGIDVKHDRFSDAISETRLWSSGMNLLFKNIEKETPEAKVARINYAFGELLRAAGPKLLKDPDYIRFDKYKDDIELILSKPRHEFQEDIVSTQKKISEIAKRIANGETDKKLLQTQKELDGQLADAVTLSQFRSLYDLSNIEAARQEYELNLVGGSKNFNNALNQRKLIKTFRDSFGDIIGKGSSADVNALNIARSSVMQSVNLDPFSDLLISRKSGKGYLFEGYSDSGKQAVFRGININSTIKNKEARLTSNRLNVDLGEDSFKAIDDKFVKTRLNLPNLIHFRVDDEINGSKHLILKSAEELAIEELTDAFTNPYETRYKSGRTRVSNLKSIFRYDENINEKIAAAADSIELKRKLPRSFLKQNEIGKEKYKIIGGMRSMIPSDDTLNLIHGYIGTANNLYGVTDSKMVIRKLNEELLEAYKSGKTEKLDTRINRHLKRYVAWGNDMHNEKYQTITADIMNAFKEGKVSQEDRFKFFETYGSYRSNIYDIDALKSSLQETNIDKEKIEEILDEYIVKNDDYIDSQEAILYSALNNDKNAIDKAFNLRAKNPGERRIAFGQYLGFPINDLSKADLKRLQKEIETVPADNKSKYYAATIAEISINDYNNINQGVANKRQNVNLQGITKSEDVDSIIKTAMEEEAKEKATEMAQKEAEVVDNVINNTVKEESNKSMGKMLQKEAKDMSDTLTGKVIGGVKKANSIGGKAFAIGSMALFAIGIANNLMHKDEQKSPLVPEATHGSARGNNPIVNHGLSKATNRSRVIYSDPSSGLNFKVSAKTANYIEQQDYQPFNGMSGQLQVHTEKDMSGVTTNWLQERLSDIF